MPPGVGTGATVPLGPWTASGRTRGPRPSSPRAAACAATGSPFLELRDDDGRQRLVVLDGRRGCRSAARRAAGCALPWDPEVSRLHAVVERIDGVWVSRTRARATARRWTARASAARGCCRTARSSAPGGRRSSSSAGPGGRRAHGGGDHRAVPDAHGRAAPRARGAVPAVAVGRVGLAGRQQGDRRRARGLRGDGQDPHAGAVRRLRPRRRRQYHKRAELARRAVAAGVVRRGAAVGCRADRRRAVAIAAPPCDALRPPTISVNPTEILNPDPCDSTASPRSPGPPSRRRSRSPPSASTRRSTPQHLLAILLEQDDSLVPRILKRIGARRSRRATSTPRSPSCRRCRPSPSRRRTPT